ncbi:MAG: tetratricopeptide repeat protein [Deltaproteobacteria bacterium]|nr:tetratricopeptide repeat protein [Deltaproteobacteria bacterium]MBW1952391.1 tetratricopeptide repeat protein [Deltaproteobacteria bacterium]
MSLKFLGRIVLASLVIWGCRAGPDPYGQQVTRATTLTIQGQQWFSQGDLQRAARDFGRALEISRSIDYPSGVAQQLNNLGAVALEQGNLETARDLFNQALSLNQEIPDWAAVSTNLANLATVAHKSGHLDRAGEYLQAAQKAAARSASTEARGRILCQLASWYLDQQELEAATAMLTQARPLATTPALQGTWNHHWGCLRLAQGDTDAALTHFNQALAADREILDRSAMAADLFGLAETYQARGELDQAFYYYGRAFDVYAILGKKSRIEECLKRLRQVNEAGRLGRSLKRFEPRPESTPGQASQLSSQKTF